MMSKSAIPLLGAFVVLLAAQHAPSQVPERRPPFEGAKPPKAVKIPGSTRITRAPDLARAVPSDRRYSVVFRFLSSGLKKFSSPEVVARDGERVTISCMSVQHCPVARVQEEQHDLAIARDIRIGTECEVTVLEVRPGEVLVDAVARVEGFGSKFRPEEAGRLVVNSMAGRVIDTIRLGETLSVEFDKEEWVVEVEVNPVVGGASSRGP